MGLDALKCIQMYISQNVKKIQKMVKNYKKWTEIANNCKISEITKYGEKMKTIDKMSKNVKKCQKNGPKTANKWSNLKTNMPSFFWLETTPKNCTSRFHTIFSSRDTHFRPFLAKIRIFGSKFQPNQNFQS